MTVVPGHSTPYEHSGSLGSSLLLGPPLTLLGVVLCSLAYGYVLVYNPLVGYASVLLVLGFGAGVGGVVAFSCRAAACRNPTFVKALAGLAGVAALYLSWVVFEYALIGRSDDTLDVNLLGLLTAPGAVFGIARSINAEGWYSISSWTPTGLTLWLFWSLEAVAVLGLAVLTAAAAFENLVFCESCHRWCQFSGVRKAPRLTFPDRDQSLVALRDGDLSVLDALDKAPDSDSKAIRVETWHCTGCGQTAAVRVAALSISVDKSGKRNERPEKTTQIFLTTPERVAAVDAK